MWIIVEKGFQDIKPDFDLGKKNQSYVGKHEVEGKNSIENQANQQDQMKSKFLDLKNIDNKRLEISNQAKITQGPAELNALINDVELKRVIHDNPWEINVKQALDNFRKRIYDNSEIKFRIGGRLIYSASKIVHAKSNLVIKESNEAQEDLIINELEGEEFDELDDKR